jgi:hypothetical protein
MFRKLITTMLVGLVTLIAGCGGSSSRGSTSSRPRTSAQLQIVNPTPNALTGPNVNVQFALDGATVAPAATLTLAPNQGHIHVSIDGKLISMAYGLAQAVNNLAPGPHTLQAEFVANDHQPFENRVLAAVLFSVKA